MIRIQYQSAGGILVRDARVLLLRKRTRNEWVLPRGRVERGETLEAAALRETREETGYLNVRVLKKLGTRRAEFQHRGRHVIRDETYYLMELIDEARDDAPTHDDAAYDRAVFEPHWMPALEAADRLNFEPARTFMRQVAARAPLQAPFISALETAR
jgi:8-oxo-dGTP pyrophosphatase MutT (NUDIX family)